MQVFVVINNVRIMMNADVNVKNWLAKENVMKDSSSVNANVKNHVI